MNADNTSDLRGGGGREDARRAEKSLGGSIIEVLSKAATVILGILELAEVTAPVSVISIVITIIL